MHIIENLDTSTWEHKDSDKANRQAGKRTYIHTDGHAVIQAHNHIQTNTTHTTQYNTIQHNAQTHYNATQNRTHYNTRRDNITHLNRTKRIQHNAQTHTHIHTYMHAYIRTSSHPYILEHIHTPIHKYIHTHIHTSIHKHIQHKREAESDINTYTY